MRDIEMKAGIRQFTLARIRFRVPIVRGDYVKWPDDHWDRGGKRRCLGSMIFFQEASTSAAAGGSARWIGSWNSSRHDPDYWMWAAAPGS